MPEITRSAAAITLLGVLSMTAMAQSPNPDATFEQDREAILAMAGDYKVTFDFRETVPLTEGYTLKDPKL